MNRIKINVSGKLVGHLSVYAITDESREHQPIIVYNGDTYSGKTKLDKRIPEECKYKTIKIDHNWLGTPQGVKGQIDVYNGSDIIFEAPLKNIVKKSASSAELTYDGVTISCQAGGVIRHTTPDTE
jgi:hypothetical protein